MTGISAKTCSCILMALLALVTSDALAQVSFNNQIRPILSRHCLTCHGADEATREADLRLDSFADATFDLGGYQALVPGDPDSSEMIIRVESADDPMPPADHGHALSPAEIALLRQWIKEGGEYETHWAFVPPALTVIPEFEHDSPSPIDQFVAAKAAQAGLKLNGPADPARLIRRLALDLTGLPPTRELTERFIARPNDETYRQIVDELLEHPGFGEHWASLWLDLGRYADTVGYASDENRTIWPWRDWLIRSLNENKPFDQFTIEMLAGDLLPNATRDQILATAFHRNTLNNNEGGTNNEEFRTVAVKDRVSTTINTWMGLTMRCAECHSHKYDPISQTEYYQFLDFFNQTADADRGDEFPTLELRPKSMQVHYRELDERIARLMKGSNRSAAAWQVIRPSNMRSTFGSELERDEDESILLAGPNPAQETLSFSFPVSGEAIRGIRIEVLPAAYHGGNVGRGQAGEFVMTQVRLEHTHPDNGSSVLMKFNAAHADYAQPGFGPENLIRESIEPNDEPLGWAVQHNQQGFDQPRSVVLQLEQPLTAEIADSATLHIVFNSKWHHRNAGRLRISTTTMEQPVARFKSGQLDQQTRQLEQLIRQRNQPVKVPVLAELQGEQRRQTHIMKRGNFQNPGEPVQAATPVAFHAFPADAARNRLGVAQWLMHEDNPLTARVMVNRLWARLFGKGIVVTEEDFGTQGTPPTHPELLDWLAIDFRDNWDVKRAIKQMVISETYQRSAKTTAKQREQDPDNVYLTWSSRTRLPAETIRDQALAVSGLLSTKMFGPPVYPPNPIKQVVNAFQGARVWQTSSGEDRYRRSLYTFLKRSQPHPLFETFDTSTRDVCSLRRINTNTPIQSFMTLNDEAFFEAAQALAVRMKEASATPREQVAAGLEMALVRKADARRIGVLEKLFQSSLSDFQKDPDSSASLLGEAGRKMTDQERAHLAALTVVANVILNLDEFLTR